MCGVATDDHLNLMSDTDLGDDQALAEGANQIPMLVVPIGDSGFGSPSVVTATSAEE